MRIFLVGPFFPWRGGIAHYSNVLAGHLLKSHDVEAITFSRQYPSFLFPGTSQYDQGATAPRVPIHQWIDSINPFSWIATAIKTIRKKPDVLIFAYSIPFFAPAFGVIARLVRMLTNARIIFLCHNVVPHEKRFGDRFLSWFAFAAVRRFIIPSPELEKELLALKSGDSYRRIVPHQNYDFFGNAIDKETAKRELNLSEEKVILFFGYVRRYKGLPILLEAMKHLPGVTLLVVGEFYEPVEEYRSMVSELGIKANVHFFTDYVPENKVVIYFSAADVVVLPYLSATGSGIAQVAYNFCRPVIATNVDGLTRVVRDGMTGFLVPPNDPTALANAIRRFYDENRMEEFSRNAGEEVKKYNWEPLVKAIEELAAEGKEN